jgi:serine/threonine protein kinase
VGVEEEMVGGVLEGRYQLTAHLEKGAFADFWEARRLDDGRSVMVKILKPELFGAPEAMARFERETRLLDSFKHPNLLEVVEMGRTPTGVPYLITELRRGRLLSDDVSNLALGVAKVCHVSSQVASVLSAAHGRGIVHRGLNPDAIMLCQEGDDADHVKVLDFGLAHLDETTGEEGITQVGQRLGAYEYMAPEYIEDFDLDARTDLYVLGVMMFEMLTGQPPFVGRPITVLDKHVNEDPWAPSEMSEHPVPEWLDRLVLALLAKEPEDRPQDGAVVVRAIAEQRYPLEA